MLNEGAQVDELKMSSGARHTVTAKMLHDTLLQKQCYNLKMLLKNNVTNTVLLQTKMLLPE